MYNRNGDKMQKQKDRRFAHIYYDKKLRPYYYDAKKKIAYFMPEKDVNKVEALYYRPVLAFSVAVVGYSMFEGSWFYYPLVFIAVWALMEYLLKKKLLPSYRAVNPYTPSDTYNRNNERGAQKKPMLLLKTGVYVALAILLGVSIYIQKNTGISLGLMLAMTIASLISAFQNLRAYLNSNQI